MPEEQMTEAVEVETPTPTGDSTVTDSSTVQEDTSPQESQSETSPEISEGQNEVKGEKPTRAERRIDQLLSKLKDKPQVGGIVNQPPPVISEDDTDGVNPQQFQQRLDQTLQYNNESMRQQIKAELAYEQTAHQHEQDLGTIADELKDPGIERMFVREYERANYQFNPLTGTMVFMPTVNPREVLSQIQKDLDAVVASKVAEAGVDLTRQAQQGAVQPSQSGGDRFSLQELKKNIWSDPASVARALESRLTYVED